MKTKLSLILMTMFVLAACGPKPAPTPAGTLPPISQSPTSLPAATAPAPLSGNVDVTIAGFAFAPDKLTVKVGTTVKWTNNDSASHNVIADDNSWGSTTLETGDSFSFTFNTAGTYAYHCGFHSSMKATITVVP
jgi:plastocyanin